MLPTKIIQSSSGTLNCVSMSYKTGSICIKVILVLGFLLFLQPVFAQPNWTELDKAIQDKQKLLGNNIVALVWNKDSMLYKKEMGEFNSKTQAPIASCSKWLTAALVMMFVDEGKLSLDDKVVKYLPEFEKYFKNYITVRHCLSHLTGITDEGGLMKRLFQRRKFVSLAEEVDGFAAREIRTNAGTDFWYGNIGLNIAGRILEVISKKKFDQLIKQKLFTPLGMKKTTFSTLNNSPVNPSGGAQSTADDYMQFLLMLLNNGKYKGQQILSEESVKLMMKVQTTPEIIKYAPKAAEGFNYALGSWVVDSPHPTSSQGGGITGTFACPGLFGTWPMIDYCKGYAYIVFVKNFLGEERADAHIEIKKTIDKQITYGCK